MRKRIVLSALLFILVYFTIIIAVTVFGVGYLFGYLATGTTTGGLIVGGASALIGTVLFIRAQLQEDERPAIDEEEWKDCEVTRVSPGDLLIVMVNGRLEWDTALEVTDADIYEWISEEEE